MITAKEAQFRSANGVEINKIKKDIEDAVNRAIKEGEYSCRVYIHVDTKDEVRDRIKEDIEKLGYQITISDSRKSSNPYVGYSGDTITIDWGKKE